MVYYFGRVGRIANFCKLNKWRRKKEIREKKNKKKVGMMKRCSVGNTSFLDDILMHEILTRLPSKSLMRFKSVCRHWLSLIQHDPHFHDAHFNRSGMRSCRLVLLLPVERDLRWWSYYGHQECFISADLDQGRAVGIIRSTRSLDEYNGVLNPVNGLICFFKKNGSVRVYNPGTREITPWICSTLVMEDKIEFEHPTYGFGFDPTTKEHKVICVWRRELPTPFVACEILSLGHNKWRRIDEVPLPYEIDQQGSLYVNGSIYWVHSKSRIGESYKLIYEPQVIIAFDVGSEKFRMIPVPSFILDQRCDGLHPADLLEVDGCVALLHRIDCHTVKLWIYFDDNYEIEKNVSTSNTNWTEETIKLPFCWGKNVSKLSFHGIAGTDLLILRLVEHVSTLHWPVSFYSYNRKTHCFKKVEISGISISDPTYSLFAPFVESLFRVSSNNTPVQSLDLKSESTGELQGPYPLLSYRV